MGRVRSEVLGAVQMAQPRHSHRGGLGLVVLTTLVALVAGCAESAPAHPGNADVASEASPSNRAVAEKPDNTVSTGRGSAESSQPGNTFSQTQTSPDPFPTEYASTVEVSRAMGVIVKLPAQGGRMRLLSEDMTVRLIEQITNSVRSVEHRYRFHLLLQLSRDMRIEVAASAVSALRRGFGAPAMVHLGAEAREAQYSQLEEWWEANADRLAWDDQEKCFVLR